MTTAAPFSLGFTAARLLVLRLMLMLKSRRRRRWSEPVASRSCDLRGLLKTSLSCATLLLLLLLLLLIRGCSALPGRILSAPATAIG